MYLTIKIKIDRDDGRVCDADLLFEIVQEEVDGLILYPQHPDADEESQYTIVEVTRVGT